MKNLLALFFLLPLFLTGCLQAIPNDPHLVEVFHQRPENLQLEFVTGKGRQVAYYLPPLNSPKEPPKRLAILYPGISSVALEWLKFIEQQKFPSTAYLLIDYPGRGLSEGMMRPEENYLNSEGALGALAEHFGVKHLNTELRVLGHSFGTGAALQFASRHQIESIVLVAPYNTLKQAVRQKSVVLGLLMPSQIDNRKLIKKILARDQPPAITILHGTKDTSLPVSMGQELAALAPKRIRFYQFSEDGHVDILTHRRSLIFQSLNGRGD